MALQLHWPQACDANKAWKPCFQHWQHFLVSVSCLACPVSVITATTSADEYMLADWGWTNTIRSSPDLSCMLSQTSSLSEHKLSVFRWDHWDLDQDAACLYSVHNLSLMLFLTGTVQCYELKKEKKDLCCNTFAAVGKYVRFKCILLALQGWNYRIFRKMKLLKII